MINITIEGPQGAGKSLTTNAIVNALMPVNLVYANGDVDTSLTDFYENPPVIGTNIVVFDCGIHSKETLEAAKRKVNDWRRKVDSKLIGIFENQIGL